MTKEPITFDKLPQAVSYLTEQVEKIYQLVETLQPQKLDHQHRLYKIFCVNGNTGFKFESRIFYFIDLQNEEDYERKESSSAR